MSSPNARELHTLCGTINNAPDVIENIYDQCEYPGTLVVENIVRLLRSNTSRDDFEQFFLGEGKTENIEWYLMHIIATLTEYRLSPTVPITNFKVYEWW